ncbi:hypothetical protein MBUL_03264 [Methylobacterium bullatum]|uniref:Uncharacterized protein n=1 Tax=Methylobacterium bullatum TaxID=570505 RepID=A0A679IXK5_9HYPH|nr:hypothetical protein MBUL_03264 [Methylobacterium bullatum]
MTKHVVPSKGAMTETAPFYLHVEDAWIEAAGLDTGASSGAEVEPFDQSAFKKTGQRGSFMIERARMCFQMPYL